MLDQSPTNRRSVRAETGSSPGVSPRTLLASLLLLSPVLAGGWAASEAAAATPAGPAPAGPAALESAAAAERAPALAAARDAAATATAAPAAADAEAQEGVLSGRVVNADTGEPVQGVRVTVVRLDRVVSTDGSGRYRIADLPTGSHQIRFERVGFRPVERRVQIREAATERLNVRLPPQAVRLREITVAPRRREELVREAPISETVFDAQELEDAEIERPKEIFQLTPGAHLVRGVDSGCCSFITVRGIGQQRNTETPIAVVVDGVQQFSPLQFDLPLYDIQRVELIRGPEGAVYGRNSVAGAMLVETREPTNEFGGYLRVGGGKGDEFTFTGAYGGPIVEDKLLFRVAAYSRTRDGYFPNITLDEKSDQLDVLNVRGKMRWHASPDFRVDFKAMFDKTESQSLSLFSYQPALLAADGRTLAEGAFPFDFENIDSNQVRRFSTANNAGDDDRDIEQFSVRLTYDLDFGQFEAISSYNSIENMRLGDQFPYTAAQTRNTAIGAIDGTQTQWKDVEGITSELRLRSREDQRVRWQAGAFFLSFDRFISGTVGIDQGQGILRLKREPAFNSTTNPTTSWLANNGDNEAWSVFGNIEIDLVPTLTLSAATRYDRELREQFVSEDNTAGEPGAVNTKTFDRAQPKFRLSYRPELGGGVLNFLNLYGSWGRGFRSGQFNQNGVAEAAADAGIEGVRDVANQENTSTGEAGFKTRWFDDRVSWETAFYQTDDEGQPFFLFIGQVGAQVLVNIPEAEIKGFESSFRARLTQGLDLYASGAITDTEIESFPVDPSAVGGRIPLVPKNTFNVGLQYRQSITSDVGIAIRGDFERLGEMAWTAVNETPRDPVNQFSLKGGLEFGRWTAKFEYDNLNDEVFNSEFVKGGFAWPGQPRRWRVSLQTDLGADVE